MNTNEGATGGGGGGQFDGLEETLEAFQENARQLGVIASDFQPKSQEALNQKLQTLITGLQEVDQMRHQFQDVKVPIELLDVLDKGQNPALFTRDVVARTLERNKALNGKVQVLCKFRALLLNELTEEMPHETMIYRSIRERGANATNASGNASGAAHAGESSGATGGPATTQGAV